MRIWDINPGYLNRQSLLGEHRELHAIHSIIENDRKGYSRHPETLRWYGYGWALGMRHRLLAAEMALRNYRDRTPVISSGNDGVWPEVYIDSPNRQFEILKSKYSQKEGGRITLPETRQQLWSHHKYSVLARDEGFYRGLGPQLAAGSGPSFEELAGILTVLLRQPPSAGGIRNAIQHMWGHLSGSSPGLPGNTDSWQPAELLTHVQDRAMETAESYLVSSTALGELMAWIAP
ncbi:MAG: hypothetical protein GF417_12685 [Candidatus Latescibacteria bacterium]|nr:hypothetical protein [bacterium]MBD3425285.1 hypothetical protein [Candidatus Latescibacterota bacterium]